MKKYIYKPYSSSFPALFSSEKKRLLQNIPECLDIQHVGSTAIPGLGGKGIIDIAIAIDPKDLENVSKKLKNLGYLLREIWSTSERLFFRIDLPDKEEGQRRYHVHLTFLQSQEWKDLLHFRDYLKSHPEAVREYSELKQTSADLAEGDGLKYRQSKAPFFKKILRQETE